MSALTTGELVKILQTGDPEGKRIVYFRIFDEDTEDDIIAASETFRWEYTLKQAQQTAEGDRPVLRLDLYLDCG